MKLYKLCIDHHDRNSCTTYCDSKFFSDLDVLSNFIMQFQHDDNWELRIFPVDAKIKYPWSREYEEK